VIALLFAAALLGSETGEEEALAELEARWRAPLPEPEPPAGLRAPSGSERFRRAAEEYRASLARWREAEARRRRELAEACSDFLRRFPGAARRREAVVLRGLALAALGDHAQARADLREGLPSLPEGSRREEALAALLKCHRALGDYARAAELAPDDPELLEEAGQVARAIERARALGRADLARRWGRIGTPLKCVAPAGKVVVLDVGGGMEPGLRAALEQAFGDRILVVVEAGGEKAQILADQRGIVRAVDPRPDTWEHRIRSLLSAE
jgi:tetratricopeptide (TPR) repeat protein